MRRLLVTALSLVAALGAAACSEEEVAVIDRALQEDQRIKSATMVFDLRATAGSEEMLFHFEGPYKNNGEGRLESFDLDFTAKVPGEEDIEGTFLSTGENVFLTMQGETYELGKQQTAQIEREMARQARKGGEVDELEDVQRLGVDLKKWFPESGGKKDGEWNGEETTTVSGELDVSAALGDFDKIMRHPAFRSQLEGQALPKLSKNDIAEIDKMISDPKFTVHVGREDGRFRRIAGQMAFKGERAADTGKMAFSFEYRDLDKPVEIKAPKGPTKPFSDLMEGMGGGKKKAAAGGGAWSS